MKPGAPCYQVHGLRRSYRTRWHAVPAVDGVHLTVATGELFGLLGPNGAGKSTLVRLLVGVLRPDAGSVRLLGRELSGRPRLASRLVGYLGQQERALVDLSCRLAVQTTARLRGLSKSTAGRQADRLLDELGLGAVADRQLARLSGGQQRLVGVATALVGDRPVLVLDEPTAGLDPAARRTVWSALRRRQADRGTTVVLVTHNVVEAESVVDRVAVLDRGRVIACDTPGRLKAGLGEQVRLDLVWRAEPPVADATVGRLASVAVQVGRRWSLRLPPADARSALDRLTSGPAFAALDDFTLATPSLEDVYLTLGGRCDDLERV